MANKIDFKKDFKEIYLPSVAPTLVTVPPILFLMVDGSGAPADEAYLKSVEVLYALAYTIKMSKMKGNQPEGYVDYTVPPLEGLWDCGVYGFSPLRENWKWTSLLRQPEFVTPAVLEWAKDQAAKKKPDLPYHLVRLQSYDEGLCVQAMHIGPYSEEQRTVDAIGAFVAENNLKDRCSLETPHHEIYVSDPRKTSMKRLKTVIRHPVIRL